MIIFEDRGKQYKAKVGEVLKLPRISSVKKDDPINIDKIIFYKNEKGESIIGSPIVKDVVVVAKVLELVRDKKIFVFKKKRRHKEQIKDTVVKDKKVIVKGDKDGS